MRIAQLAPLYEPVPPEGYGGTELAVHQITEELVRRGQEDRHVEACLARAAEFEIVHNHAGLEGMEAAARSPVPVVTTHHLAFEPGQRPVFDRSPWAHHALSAAAARTFPTAGQLPPIHHGIDIASYPFNQ